MAEMFHITCNTLLKASIILILCVRCAFTKAKEGAAIVTTVLQYPAKKRRSSQWKNDVYDTLYTLR